MSQDTEVVERTLTFHRDTGMFTLSSPSDSITQDGTGAFQIALAAPGTIIIHAEPGIAFMSASEEALGPLPFKTSGSILLPSNQFPSNQNQIAIDVPQLPSRRGVLGFLLFARLPQDSDTVVGIQAPPFFVTREQSSEEQDLLLHYERSTGDFTLRQHDALDVNLRLPGTIKVEKGLFVPRVSNDSLTNNNAVRHIRVHLTSDDPEVVFAHPPAVFTLASGPTVQRISDTEILISKDFTPGTGFGVIFGVKIPIGGETCTVYSPDPVIIDKTVGSNPPTTEY